MVRARAIGESGWFHIHKNIGEHTCGIDHVTRKHKNVTMEVIASLTLKFFIDNKGVIAKNIVRGTPNNGYAVLPAFSYVFNGLNPGYTHMRKVVAVDGTYLSGKYEGMLLSAVAQDTQNHIYPLAYYVVDEKNSVSWGFFFEKLKAFIVDESELGIIFDRHAYTLEEFNDYFNALKERCPGAATCLEHEVGF
ncbi:hypothetical protein P3S67_009690 [Capsicum chacoense]